MVRLKRPPLRRLSSSEQNYFRFLLGPEISIAAGIGIKCPGKKLSTMLTELVAVKNSTGDVVEAYERLLTDSMNGDPLLFIREDAVEVSWGVVENILDSSLPLHFYHPGSWGPLESEHLATDIGGWQNPC